MVAGGYGKAGQFEGRLDSTEIFQDNIWRVVAGKLPWSYPRVATMNNRVLGFGR